MRKYIDRIRHSALFRDSFWALSGTAIGKGLSLIASIVVARLLGSEAFGEYGIIKGTLLSIAIFSSFGLGYTATKFIAENLGNERNYHISSIHKIVFSITFIFSGALAFVVAIFSNDIAIWLKDETLGSILRWSSIAILLNAIITSQNGELGGFRAYKMIAKNNLIYGVTMLVISVPAAYYGGLKWAVIALIISLAINVVVNEISIQKQLPKSEAKISRKFVMKILSFSLPIALQESLYSFTSWGGMAILARLSDYSQLGLYSAASQWMAVMLFIPGALRNVALSHLSNNSNNRASSNHITNRLLLVNFTSTIIPFILILCCGGIILKIYGNSFDGLLSILNICVFTAVVNSLSNVLTQELIAFNFNWYLFWTRFIRDSLSLVLTYYFITYGFSGAIALSTSWLVMQIIYLFLLFFKHYKIYHCEY